MTTDELTAPEAFPPQGFAPRTAPEQQTALLAAITGPESLRELSPAQLPRLAEEIRAHLVERVCASGGHLGVNLGVVELTIALHRVFDSPRDVLLYDTGHQTYVHKILTGRADRFDSLRKADGLSGYPSRAESPHDWVENSHASTALSYADGLAKALRLSGTTPSRQVVAVVGDGSLTGGLAWEGLNNLGAAPERPVVVLLNDNGRSYAPTVGGLAAHLVALRSGRAAVPLFQQLGLAYIGPVDGHDIPAVEAALRSAVALRRPVVVHTITSKGRGYGPAEEDQEDHMHGVGVLDPATGRPRSAARRSWTDEFGDRISAIGAERPDVVCLTAAMLEPVGLGGFSRRFPERVFDVGLSEQHAACSAAGLAMGGLHPVVCLYATFLNRAFDQVLMDVALHRQPVTFVLDRAGITGPDGPSHHGVWDLAVLSAVPGLRVAAPRDATRLGELLAEAVAIDDGPTALRFPKASVGPDLPAVADEAGLDVLHRTGPADVLLVAVGVMAEPCVRAAEELAGLGVGVTVVDPRWVLPVPSALVSLAARHRVTVCVEDGTRIGGVGAAVAQACADAGVSTPVRALGIPREFVEAGDRAEILRRFGLSPAGIAEAACTAIAVHADNHAAQVAGRHLDLKHV